MITNNRGLETTLEYQKGVAIIHLGRDVNERVTKTEKYIEEEAKKAKGLILDYQYVFDALSRDGGLIIIAADKFNPKSVYLCNAGKNIKGLELLGILSIDGVYRESSVEKALEKICQK